jgi:hypothetical protein
MPRCKEEVTLDIRTSTIQIKRSGIIYIIVIMIMIDNAYAGHLNSFTHLRALLVVHDRGMA